MRRRKHEAISGNNRFRGLNSALGFTLLEIMIAVAIGCIGVLGVTVLFSDLAKIQKNSSTIQMLTTFRTSIVTAVVKKTTAAGAWDVSIADANAGTGNPLLGCLRTNTECTKDVPIRFSLKNVDGTELFNSRRATRGFTWDGAICDTFSLVTPDLGCPFSWNLTVTARCVGTDKPACVNPIMQVDGILQYSPGADDPLTSGINLANYSISIRRGVKTDKNEPLVVTYVEADNSGEAGSCWNAAGTLWTPRKFNTIVTDPGSNVAAVGPSSFTLTAGTYECRIQAPAFKNGGNTLRLLGTGVDIYSGVTSASLTGDAVTVTMQANFSIGANTSLQVLHHCTQKPSDAAFGSPNDNFMLGVPAPGALAGDYSNSTFSVVSCVKTSG